MYWRQKTDHRIENHARSKLLQECGKKLKWVLDNGDTLFPQNSDSGDENALPRLRLTKNGTGDPMSHQKREEKGIYHGPNLLENSSDQGYHWVYENLLGESFPMV